MQERLVIRNFGPIKSVDLNLGRMTILIGDNATGKSTIGKVLAVCRYFSYIVDLEIITSYESRFVEYGLSDWGIKSFLNHDSYIEYENEDYKLVVQFQEEEVLVDKNNDGKGHYVKMNLFKPKLTEKSERFVYLMNSFWTARKQNLNMFTFTDFPYEFLANNVKPILNNPFFIPAERSLQSIFSLGKNSLKNMNDSLYNQFDQLYNIANDFAKETDIKPLNLIYKNNNGQGFIKKIGNNQFHSLYSGATGFQSTIPIVLVVNYYAEKERRLGRTYIIEEPEINLFPTNQKKLIEFFIESINKYNNQFILPTHSPYLLSTLYNLIYAKNVAQISEKAKNEVNTIVNEEHQISIDEVAVYALENGEAIDLVDRIEKTINIDFIDSVSEVNNEIFDKLIDIKMKNEFN